MQLYRPRRLIRLTRVVLLAEVLGLLIGTGAGFAPDTYAAYAPQPPAADKAEAAPPVVVLTSRRQLDALGDPLIAEDARVSDGTVRRILISPRVQVSGVVRNLRRKGADVLECDWHRFAVDPGWPEGVVPRDADAPPTPVTIVGKLYWNRPYIVPQHDPDQQPATNRRPGEHVAGHYTISDYTISDYTIVEHAP